MRHRYHRTGGHHSSRVYPLEVLVNRFSDAVRTSEFWTALLGAVLTVLVSQGIISEDARRFAEMAVVYAIGRLISKAAKTIPVEVK